MKTVFSNSMLAHVWAQLKQPHGRSDSMKFDGAVAYSYAEPVAHIVAVGSQNIALFTSRKWSQTTQGHISSYRSSASHLTQFVVPDILLGRFVVDPSDAYFKHSHDANVAYFQDQYADELASMMRATAESYSIRGDSPRAKLIELANQLYGYARLFALNVPDFEIGRDADKVIARRDRLLNDPKRAAKREAGRLQRERAEELRYQAQQKRSAELAVAQAAEIEAWKAGADVRLYHNHGICALLRVHGGLVQSSQGAECPIADAMDAIRMVRIVVARGKGWQRNGETLPLGQFQVDFIEPNGNMRAGCHRIEFTEIDRIGKLLGV